MILLRHKGIYIVCIRAIRDMYNGVKANVRTRGGSQKNLVSISHVCVEKSYRRIQEVHEDQMEGSRIS